MANTAADIQKLYIAYFNRPADPAGLDYWTKSNMSITQIANSFAEQAEYKAAFAAQSTETIVATLYVNMFGRTADAAGFSYWVGEILAGRSTLGSAAINILNGAKDADKIAIDSKVTAATSFTTALNETDEMVAYSKAGGTAAAKVWLGAVSTVATATSQIAAQDAVIKSIVAAAIANNGLTNGTDILSGAAFSAPQVYTPGGDDRINSLQDEDVLTGTANGITAQNTLTATLGNSNDNGSITITPTLNNMDVVNVAFTGSNATDAVKGLDLQDATRVSEVNISRVSSVVNEARIENIQSALSKMSIANSNANNAGTVEFSFGKDVLKTLDKDNKPVETVGTLNLSNVQIGTVNIGENIDNGVGVNASSYENLTINSTGSSNTVGTLKLPMDTGTAGKIVITGDKNLNLSTSTNITSTTVTSNIEAVNYAGGITAANGRLAAIDASAFTGNLTLNIASGTFTTGKADTSGVVQNVTITGGKGNDTFYLADELQTGDSLTGGDGTDTLTIVAGGSIVAGAAGSSIITKVEALNVFMNGASSSVDFDKLPDVTGVTVRNIGNSGGLAPVGQNNTNVAFTLNNLTVAQAAAITVLHSTTGNGDITNTTVSANLKTSSGTADTVAVTLLDGVNTDGRFNLTLNASGAENLTINNNDSESNIVELGTNSSHTGTITVKGTTASTVINFDVDTAAAAGTTTGLLRQNVGGSTTANLNLSGAVDVADLSTQVRIGAATFDASAEAANVIARFSTNAASNVGAQKISTGTGNDTVIFDALSDNRAGLTISDTVDGGAGTDTLVIDGNLSVAGVIALGASEWTNVSAFETIRLVNAGTGSTYSLTLTDTLISKNNLKNADGTNGALTITNDNDTANDAASGSDTAGVSNESAVVIDARALNNTSRFNYNGEEGTSRTADRIIMSDVNLNGTHNINGGAVDNLATTFTANADILEIRNTAVATLGDLANIRNIGQISFNNDQAVAQTLTLQLDAATADALVDSYHTASATEREALIIKANDATAGLTSVSAAQFDIDATALGDFINLTITGETAGAAAFNGTDIVRLTASAAAGVQTIDLGLGANDKIAFSGGNATTTITATINAGNSTIVVAQGANTVTHTANNYEVLDLTGFAGTAALTGGANALTLTGGAQNDTINSGAFTVTINGGGGNDQINLNAGATQTVALANTAASADTIATFTQGTDKLQLSKALFTALTSIAGAGFSVGAEAVVGLATATSAGLIKIDNSGANGLVYYDADGTGAGALVLIATLTGVNNAVAGDFVIVA